MTDVTERFSSRATVPYLLNLLIFFSRAPPVRGEKKRKKNPAHDRSTVNDKNIHDMLFEKTSSHTSLLFLYEYEVYDIIATIEVQMIVVGFCAFPSPLLPKLSSFLFPHRPHFGFTQCALSVCPPSTPPLNAATITASCSSAPPPPPW